MNMFAFAVNAMIIREHSLSLLIALTSAKGESNSCRCAHNVVV